MRKTLPPLPAARRPKIAAAVVPACRSAAGKDVTGDGRLMLRANLHVVGRAQAPRSKAAGRRIGATSC